MQSGSRGAENRRQASTRSKWNPTKSAMPIGTTTQAVTLGTFSERPRPPIHPIDSAGIVHPKKCGRVWTHSNGAPPSNQAFGVKVIRQFALISKSYLKPVKGFSTKEPSHGWPWLPAEHHRFPTGVTMGSAAADQAPSIRDQKHRETGSDTCRGASGH